MTKIKKYSRVKSLQSKLLGGAIVLSLTGSIIFTSCSSSSNEPTYTIQVKEELMKGIITELEEVSEGEFKVTDETVVPTKEESRIIALYLDGQRDTFTLQEVIVEKETGSSSGRHHRSSSGFGGMLYGTMIGYHMGRSMGSPLSPTAYKTPATYNKSQKTTGSVLKNSVKRTSVRKPTKSSSGYGTKSTRSYGG